MAKTQVTTQPAKTTTAAAKGAAAPAKTAAPAAPEKAPTKMERAAPIFQEVMAMTEEQLAGKTHRRVFMDRALAELDMKPAGANTYFQNLKNESNGEGRYKYTPASSTPASQAAAAPQSGDPVIDALNKLGTQISTLNRTVKTLAKAQAQHA